MQFLSISLIYTYTRIFQFMNLVFLVYYLQVQEKSQHKVQLDLNDSNMQLLFLSCSKIYEKDFFEFN